MPKVYFGRRDEGPTELHQTQNLVAVRTHTTAIRRGEPLRGALAVALPSDQLIASFPEANVGVYRTLDGVTEAKARLLALPQVRFAGRVLVDDGGEPVVYTENLFVKFEDEIPEAESLALFGRYGLAVKRRLDYASNAYFVAADGAGQKVFEIAESLLDEPGVEYAHPEVVRRRARKAIHPQQWHLQDTVVNGTPVQASANVEAAHRRVRGDGVIVAVIDDGVDIDHPEFAAPGKVVAPRDVTLGSNDPRPKDDHPASADNHGTACAGVACAAGLDGASGVAPNANLMPIRLSSALGALAEADAFVWAADHGADVISCSWGPWDGDWWNPNDPAHATVWPMPASTRLAIDHCVRRGRAGRGCVILFASGNGNEDVGNDGYASYREVIAVAACNDRGLRSVYSDFGDAIWCAFPSNDIAHQPSGSIEPITAGIWTTDRRGRAGYNPGNTMMGDAGGDYANDFGGTSSACPGAAGVAALVLSANQELTYLEVREILRRASVQIDVAGGAYDARGWSRYYGWGRLDAARAVELAADRHLQAVQP